MTFLTDKGRIECSRLINAFVEPIPAPKELVDGAAYMFDYKHASYIGIYASPPHRFIQVDGWTLSSYCTNIRLMTVESK